jgi:aspartyl-tRNA(Asn)/glutamyl-tRNA(Gln) amidotransferase subunit A
MYLADVFTLAQPLAGIPAMSIPCGFDNGLPVGLQIMARAFEEEKMLRVAYAYEQSTAFHQERPVVVEPGTESAGESGARLPA